VNVRLPRTIASPTWTLVTLLVVGCSPSEGTPSESGPPFVLVEDLRIGSADGPLEEQFGDIWGVLPDATGRIYILDGQAQEVRVFEPDGRFSHSIGRRGEGPGEMTSAGGVRGRETATGWRSRSTCSGGPWT
jgi:hypothetical protein